MSTSTRDKRGMGTKKRAGRPKNPTTTTLRPETMGYPNLLGRGGGKKGGRYEKTKKHRVDKHPYQTPCIQIDT